MKKYLFIAAAAAGLLTACSSDNEVNGGGGNEGNGSSSTVIDDTKPAQILFGTGISASTTRGTGTVGGTTQESNLWAGQTVNVLMLNKGTLTPAVSDLTTSGSTSTPDNLFWDAAFTTPSNSQSEFATPADGSVKYYPAVGQFDFVGYRLDDAGTSNAPVYYAEDGATTTGAEGASYIGKPFSLNGSQDVMYAKAPTNQQIAYTVGNATQYVATDRLYSAYAARRGVHPDLNFSHLLTRLTFEVAAADAADCLAKGSDTELSASTGQIYVSAIKVRSKYTGTLIIAGENEGTINWTADTEDATNIAEMALMDRAEGNDANDALTNLVQFPLTYSVVDGNTNVPDVIPAGEALFVAPQDSYELIVELKQRLVTSTGSYQEVTRSIGADSNNPFILTTDDTDTPAAFEAGGSYNVKITVYGIEEIKIKTSITAWEDKGDIEMSTDQ